MQVETIKTKISIFSYVTIRFKNLKNNIVNTDMFEIVLLEQMRDYM